MQPAAFVTVTVYVPAFATEPAEMVGFCRTLVKPFGPLQEYDPPPEAASAIVPPAQYTPPLLAEAVGVGNAFTVTVTLAQAEWPQEFSQRA